MTALPQWPKPPRQQGPWAGGPPVAPPGNTALPPLPGPGGVSRTSASATNPWANAESIPAPPRYAPRPAFPGLQAGVLPRIDRAPRWIIVVSAVIVVALLGGTAYLVTNPRSQYPSKWDPRVAPIASWVSRTRNLTYEHPVEVQFLSPAEYRKASGGGGSESESTAQKKQMDDTVAQFRALGFLEGDVDLGAATDVLSDSGTLAFYSAKSKMVYVRGTKLTPGLRVTLAHELTHVLQDQHSDLQRLDSLPDSQAPVLRALAEGDATRIEDRYVDEVLTDAERTAYVEENASSLTAADKKLAAKVPAVMTTLFGAPYRFGPELITYLEANGGDDAINAALQNLPTEAVLFNPLIKGTPAAEAGKLTVEAPSGTEKIEDGEFGPTAWYLLLASRMEARSALVATDGLGADGYTVYRENKKVCVRASAEGDTPGDLMQLAVALQAWVAKSAPGTAKFEIVGAEARLQSCDPGAAAKAAGKVTEALLSLPIARTQIYNESVKAGATSKQGTCFGQGVVNGFTLEQLNSETFLPSPLGQQALATIRNRCR